MNLVGHPSGQEPTILIFAHPRTDFAAKKSFIIRCTLRPASSDSVEDLESLHFREAMVALAGSMRAITANRGVGN